MEFFFQFKINVVCFQIYGSAATSGVNRDTHLPGVSLVLMAFWLSICYEIDQ